MPSTRSAIQPPLVRHDLCWSNKVSFAPLNLIAIVTSPQVNCTHDWQVWRMRMKDNEIHNGLFILMVLRIYMAAIEGRPNVTLGSILGRGCNQGRPFPRYLSSPNYLGGNTS